MDNERYAATIFITLGALVLTFILGILGYCSVQAIRSDGEIKYCYVELNSPQGMPPVYQLYGFRPWCTNRHIGTYQKLDEAIEAAGKTQCTLKQVPKF